MSDITYLIAAKAESKWNMKYQTKQEGELVKLKRMEKER